MEGVFFLSDNSLLCAFVSQHVLCWLIEFAAVYNTTSTFIVRWSPQTPEFTAILNPYDWRKNGYCQDVSRSTSACGIACRAACCMDVLSAFFSFNKEQVGSLIYFTRTDSSSRSLCCQGANLDTGEMRSQSLMLLLWLEGKALVLLAKHFTSNLLKLLPAAETKMIFK